MTGIRVEATCFERCWEILKPDIPPPIVKKAEHVWKLEPFPWGMDKAILQEWLDKISWRAQPMKPLGPKSWLFCSDEPPPPGILRFNEFPLLIKETTNRSSTASLGVVAGKPSASSPAQETNNAANIFRTGDPHFDPWNGKTLGQPSTSSTMPSVGPSTQRMDQQEQRLDALEKNFRQLHEQTTQQNTDQNNRMQSLEQTVHHNTQQVHSAFQSMRTDFEQTLQQAMLQQDGRYESTLDEIKNLLLRKDKRRRAQSSDEELQSDN